ncbi:hypothetical protein GCM10009545_31870 [Saccharopolyspora thermophila]|uniref:Amine oxidase domain-containing protein n=1 Tax=Saccharopolyspora thermophila TaxID=89367 RepID=A0ABP3MT34_9PSEU
MPGLGTRDEGEGPARIRHRRPEVSGASHDQVAGPRTLRQTLTCRSERVFLAGDHLGTFDTETEIHTGLFAAQEVRSLLATERQSPRITSQVRSDVRSAAVGDW